MSYIIICAIRDTRGTYDTTVAHLDVGICGQTIHKPPDEWTDMWRDGWVDRDGYK